MSENIFIARVAVPVPIFRLFDYKTKKMPKVGARVLVPFAKRQLVGIVVDEVEPQNASVDSAKLKSVSKVLDSELIPHSLIDMAQWIASYYLVPIGMVYELILPVKLRKGEPSKPTGETHWRLNNDVATKVQPEDFGRAFAQRALFEFLRQKRSVNALQLNENFKQWRSAMQALEKKNMIETSDVLSFSEYEAQPSGKKLTLNSAQQQVIDSIEDAFSTHLIHGITGSGKTEVYLSIVEKQLLNGQQALLLVPEISLTPQFVERVRQRLNKSVAVVHSSMNDNQRHKAWWAAKNGHVDIVLGTRASVFTAFKDLRIIIVDEEHDSSFKQQDGVRYHARDVAIMRAKQHNIPVVLGSATPSLEALHNAALGKFKLSTLAKRATGASLPEMHLIDCSGSVERLENGLSPSLLKHIKNRLVKKQQTILFINRRGFSPTLYCTECGWTAQCPRCDARVTAHIDPNTGMIKNVRCHHCGYQAGTSSSQFNQCGACHQHTVMPLGAGTQRSEEALRQHFPQAVITRLDRDAITTKTALEKELSRIKSGEVDIIIGTQMLTKGHDFPNVTLVGVLDADQGLFALDFRSQEKLYQQLLQISGRAGRHEQQGEVYIQTQFPDHAFYQQLLTQDYVAFAEQEIENRRLLSYPPIGYISLLRAESHYAKQGLDFLRWCKNHVELQEGVFVSDAVPAPMEKRAGRYRAQLMMHSRSRSDLHHYQHRLISVISNSKQQKSVRWSLDVDPIDLY